MYQRKYKCPFCDKRETREKLISHISKYHKELIPEKLYVALYNYKVKIENDKNYVA